MSKNYYITTKDPGFLFDNMKDAEINYDKKRFEIHIAQTVGSLTPLLQTHQEFSTWYELSHYLKENKEHIEIIDEYEIKMEINDFLDMLKDENKKNKSRMSVFPDMKQNDIYYRDDDGYEWCKREFC